MFLSRRRILLVSLGILLLMAVAVALLATRAAAQPQLALYLVKEPDPAIWQTAGLDALSLEDTPLLTDADLRTWRWSDHTLFLLDEAAVEARLPGVPTYGLPFVIMVNDERIYLGAFWTSLSSQSTDLPIIDIILEPWQIRPGYPWPHEMDPDMRSDGRIKQALKQLRKLS